MIDAPLVKVEVDPVLISIVRTVYPSLIAYDLVGVQPMIPISSIIAIKPRYENHIRFVRDHQDCMRLARLLELGTDATWIYIQSESGLHGRTLSDNTVMYFINEKIHPDVIRAHYR